LPDGIQKHPDIKVLSDNQNAKGSREGGLEVMTSLLAANPKIDGVFAINDPTAIGADLARNRRSATSSLSSAWMAARTVRKR
jgi:ABC-type sugar transport system substrate-binding protein